MAYCRPMKVSCHLATVTIVFNIKTLKSYSSIILASTTVHNILLISQSRVACSRDSISVSHIRDALMIQLRFFIIKTALAKPISMLGFSKLLFKQFSWVLILIQTTIISPLSSISNIRLLVETTEELYILRQK